MKKGFRYALFATAVLLLASCSATKYVPEGSYLLDEVRIQTDNREIKPSGLSMYVRQNPNAKWFSLIKTQLYVYNWSGRDSARWINRTLRRIGDAPVIYKEEETKRSGEEMKKAVQNMGYMSATVEPVVQIKKKKLKLTYKVSSGKPYKIRSLKYDIRDEKIREYMRQDSAGTYLTEGMYFDVNRLDAERQRITDNLLRNGYYKFNKEYISYTADTVRNTYQVDVTMHLAPFRQPNDHLFHIAYLTTGTHDDRTRRDDFLAAGILLAHGQGIFSGRHVDFQSTTEIGQSLYTLVQTGIFAFLRAARPHPVG